MAQQRDDTDGTPTRTQQNSKRKRGKEWDKGYGGTYVDVTEVLGLSD